MIQPYICSTSRLLIPPSINPSGSAAAVPLHATRRAITHSLLAGTQCDRRHPTWRPHLLKLQAARPVHGLDTVTGAQVCHELGAAIGSNNCGMAWEAGRLQCREGRDVV